jgi:hypothetical protein
MRDLPAPLPLFQHSRAEAWAHLNRVFDVESDDLYTRTVGLTNR